MGIASAFNTLVFGCFSALTITTPLVAEVVTVFAASSLKESLEEIADTFETATGQEITLSFAGSSALARQIEFGAPADLFISASTDWMDHLEATGQIDATARFDLLGNRLVLIGAAGSAPVNLESDTALADRLMTSRLAMALTEAVPAGIYGKAALQSLDLWDSVAAQVAQTDSARAALALVTLGAAPLGIVYRTDALAEPRVSILAEFPPEMHPRISYSAARVVSSQSEAAVLFLDHLRAPEAKAVFERYGFLLRQD